MGDSRVDSGRAEMPGDGSSGRFWWQWVAANALGEWLGLGAAALVGGAVALHMGDARTLAQSLGVAALFIALGAFEGLVVGYAQDRVLRQRLPAIRGWVAASAIGAVVAWALGMVPSTVMDIVDPAAAPSPPEIGDGVRLLLAAALGAVTGPVLAYFQWRRLRECLTRHAGWWLPANALAWALGMPIVFAGADLAMSATGALSTAVTGSLSLLLAGAVVGAVHGRVLVWMLQIDARDRSASKPPATGARPAFGTTRTRARGRARAA